MSRKRLFTTALALCIACPPLAAHAELKLPNLGFGANRSTPSDASGAANTDSGAATTSGGADTSALSQLVQNYAGANQQVLSGQSTLASAMGLGSAASRANAAASALGSNPTSGALEKSASVQSSLTQSLSRALSSRSTPAVTGANKQTFTDGLASLGQGVSKYAGLRSDLSAVQGSMSPASLLQGGMDPSTAKSAMFAAKSVPTQLQSLGSMLSQAVSYASSHGISVPSAATAALSALR